MGLPAVVVRGRCAGRAVGAARYGGPTRGPAGPVAPATAGAPARRGRRRRVTRGRFGGDGGAGAGFWRGPARARHRTAGRAAPRSRLAGSRPPRHGGTGGPTRAGPLPRARTVGTGSRVRAA